MAAAWEQSFPLAPPPIILCRKGEKREKTSKIACSLGFSPVSLPIDRLPIPHTREIFLPFPKPCDSGRGKLGGHRSLLRHILRKRNLERHRLSRPTSPGGGHGVGRRKRKIFGVEGRTVHDDRRILTDFSRADPPGARPVVGWESSDRAALCATPCGG